MITFPHGPKRLEQGHSNGAHREACMYPRPQCFAILRSENTFRTNIHKQPIRVAVTPPALTTTGSVLMLRWLGRRRGRMEGLGSPDIDCAEHSPRGTRTRGESDQRFARFLLIAHCRLAKGGQRKGFSFNGAF